MSANTSRSDAWILRLSKLFVDAVTQIEKGGRHPKEVVTLLRALQVFKDRSRHKVSVTAFNVPTIGELYEVKRCFGSLHGPSERTLRPDEAQLLQGLLHPDQAWKLILVKGSDQYYSIESEELQDRRFSGLVGCHLSYGRNEMGERIYDLLLAMGAQEKKEN